MILQQPELRQAIKALEPSAVCMLNLGFPTVRMLRFNHSLFEGAFPYNVAMALVEEARQVRENCMAVRMSKRLEMKGLEPWV